LLSFPQEARDYAVGIAVSAAQAGTPTAKNWVKTQWIPDFVGVMLHQIHWWVLGCLAFALILSLLRNRQQSRSSHRDSGPNGR